MKKLISWLKKHIKLSLILCIITVVIITMIILYSKLEKNYYCDEGYTLYDNSCIKNVDVDYDDKDNVKDYVCELDIYDISEDKKTCTINEDRLKKNSKEPELVDDYICHAGVSYYEKGDYRYCFSSTNPNITYQAEHIKSHKCEQGYVLRTLDYNYHVDNPDLMDLPKHAERICVKDEYKDYHNVTNSVKVCKNGYSLKNDKCAESRSAKYNLSFSKDNNVKQYQDDTEIITLLGSFKYGYVGGIVGSYTGTFTFKNGKLTAVSYVTTTDTNNMYMVLRSVNTRFNGGGQLSYKWDIGFLRDINNYRDNKDYIAYEVNINDIDKMNKEKREIISSYYLVAVGGKNDYLIEDWNRLYEEGVDPSVIHSKIEHIKLADRNIESFYKFLKENQGHFNEILIMKGKPNDSKNTVVFDGKDEYSIEEYNAKLQKVFQDDVNKIINDEIKSSHLPLTGFYTGYNMRTNSSGIINISDNNTGVFNIDGVNWDIYSIERDENKIVFHLSYDKIITCKDMLDRGYLICGETTYYKK